MINETIEQEMKSLRYIVNECFDTDILKSSRVRNIVDARLVYSKILRDRAHTFQSIASSLNKDHTSIIHYMGQIDHILEHDVRLADKYFHCKALFLRDRPDVSENIKESNALHRLIKLTLDYEALVAKQEEFNAIRNKYKRIEGIIEMIDIRTPKGKERKIKSEINKMFNGIDQKSLH